MMLKRRLNSRIIVIFLLPVIALVYFSFHFTSNKFDELNESAVYTLAAKITKTVAELVHNIQIERGLSSGYVVLADSEPYMDELLQRYQSTDNAYQQFLLYQNLVSQEKRDLEATLLIRNKVKIKEILAQMRQLTRMRSQVQKHEVHFVDVIEYYTKINTNLINLIYSLSTYSHQSFSSSVDIYKIQQIKEKAGLERAYLYKQLLSQDKSLVQRSTLRELIFEQHKFTKELHEDLSPRCMMLYNKVITVKAQKRVERYRDDFWADKLTQDDARDWFHISTLRIDEFEKLSLLIIGRFITGMESVHDKAKHSLFITLLLWLLSGISFLFALYTLVRSMANEAKLIEDLRVASYAFEAHEAMMIMDPRGVIMRVNRAFSRITGYEASEVIGKSPKMLGSSKNPKGLYKKIWQAFVTHGYWSGEIYNKRKTGKVYINKLSVVSIKNKDNETTHCMAQFLDISELKEAQERAMHRAKYDFLTQIPNRESMMTKLKEEFARANRHHFYNAFLFVDVDNFKGINDKYGHLIGDETLKEVAKRMQSSIRVEDYLARMSGDEFCIILVDLSHSKKKARRRASIITKGIIQNLSLPYSIDGKMIKISASIGIKLFPEKKSSIQEVINDADFAMYEAKKRGKNRFIHSSKIDEFLP
jgi:diguanylate cyclase (GGDEF)-like protein/PAS domain S-box-containing protein